MMNLDDKKTSSSIKSGKPIILTDPLADDSSNICASDSSNALIISALDSSGKVIKADLRKYMDQQQLQSVLKKSISGGATVVTTTATANHQTVHSADVGSVVATTKSVKTLHKFVPKQANAITNDVYFQGPKNKVVALQLKTNPSVKSGLISKPILTKVSNVQTVFPNVTVVKKAWLDQPLGSKVVEIKSTPATSSISKTIPHSLSSNLTITKTTISKSKMEQPPLVSLEKTHSLLLNPTIGHSTKRGSILLSSNADPLHIVVNSIGGNKVINLSSISSPAEDKKSKPQQQQSLLKSNENKESNVPKTPPSNRNNKQQSLLKNKNLESVHGSPRTQRSKSLTAFKGQAHTTDLNRSRKMSASSDGDIQLFNAEAAEKAFKSNAMGEPEKANNGKALLFCDERLEEIPTSSSEPPSDSSLVIDENPLAMPEEEEEMQLLSSEIEDEKSQSKSTTEVHENSPASMLDWKDGVGRLKKLDIPFQLNEFGILEVREQCPSTRRLDIGYEKPIYEREALLEPKELGALLYTCKGCSNTGSPTDFLAPSYCSHDCIKRAWRERRSHLYKTNPKRNRRKFDMRPYRDVAIDSVICIRRRKPFQWPEYLEETRCQPAWVNLFLNPFPTGPNEFQVGMKLEAIDPENSALFCVCTIIEISGFRLKLNFDGYSKKFGFWVNADSMDIFPPGWCAKTNRILQPPNGMGVLGFNWPTYLGQTDSAPAPRHLFTHLNSSSTNNQFEIGMKLEADDIRNSRKTCVATIMDIIDNRLLIHFDGWDAAYDYWIDIYSPYIHPVNWHKRNEYDLETPPDWHRPFSWLEYLKTTHSKPAIEDYFSRRDPINFGPGMKLEVVDKKTPQLIRAATIVTVEEYEVKVLFEGWPEMYSFWVADDSPDIHPINWCTITGHELEPPIGYEGGNVVMPCPNQGCRGIGNAKRFDIDFHANAESCPYEYNNWNADEEKPNRLEEAKEEVRPRVKRKSSNMVKDVNANSAEPLVKEPKLEVVDTDEEEDVKNVATENFATKPTDSNEFKIARELLSDYGPRLEQNFEIFMNNSRNLAESFGEIHKNPLEWTINETAEFVMQIPKCHRYADLFITQEVDGPAFLAMRQSDLTDILNIKLGPAIKLYSAIVRLRIFVLRNFKDSLAN